MQTIRIWGTFDADCTSDTSLVIRACVRNNTLVLTAVIRSQRSSSTYLVSYATGAIQRWPWSNGGKNQTARPWARSLWRTSGCTWFRLLSAPPRILSFPSCVIFVLRGFDHPYLVFVMRSDSFFKASRHESIKRISSKWQKEKIKEAEWVLLLGENTFFHFFFLTGYKNRNVIEAIREATMELFETNSDRN